MKEAMEIDINGKLILTIITGLILLPCSVLDLRTKKLPVWFLAVGGVVVLIAVVLTELQGKGNGLISRIAGAAIGVVFLLLALFLRGKLGSGDGFVLCITGLALGFYTNLTILSYGLILAGLISGVLLLLHKVNKNGTLPLIPFLFCGYLICLFNQ